MPPATFLECQSKFLEQIHIETDQFTFGDNTVIQQLHQRVRKRQIWLREGLFQRCALIDVNDVVGENSIYNQSIWLGQIG